MPWSALTVCTCNHIRTFFGEQNSELCSRALQFTRECMDFFLTDLFEDFLYISPNAAAKNLLIEVSTKRKGVLEPTIQFIMEILSGTSPEPMKKDGALHMLGALAKKLSKRKEYKNNMEIVLVRNVFPEFQSEFGFLRARVRALFQSELSDSKF